ncbi:hypothetical protein [Bifidobacterium platyrrhinorum]|uniref:Uncharacterized protein n=1 Tax=Bifidobacterium platyrrhinorum TaxID=2661628 RepID=A0A6L9STI3_9BIFI|nr:hypothetical protein [Bifidobacterium platyrrhinorum]NEG55399.1 hypothetical protein [Bifidobacterium platyrrhinorum]
MNKYGKANRRKARRIERRTSEASIKPQAYSIPVGAEDEDVEYYYSEHVSIMHRLKTYRGRVVAFSIQIRETDEEQRSLHCIFRYDMAMPESDLHRHVLHPNGDNLGDKTVVDRIPSDGTGSSFVASKYEELAVSIYDIVEAQYERWCSEK